MYYVYWYHLPEHTDIKTQGYVGITKNLNARNSGHKHTALAKKSSYRFSQAIRKYRGNILRTVVCITTKKHSLYLEEKLRPNPNIGWNSAIGGGDAPSPLGRKHSSETKKKIGNAHRGKSRGVSPFRGVTNRHSESTRALIGSYHKGKIISEEHKRAISDKLSGINSPVATAIHLVHRDKPLDVLTFLCIKVAADTLGLNYNSLRSLAQSTMNRGYTSEPAKSGWICLHSSDVNNPKQAVNISVNAHSKRSALSPKASGTSNPKSRSIILENTLGEIKTYESINLAAKAIGMSEATLRYHEQQTHKKQKDANFTKQGWRVKYTEAVG